MNQWNMSEPIMTNENLDKIIRTPQYVVTAVGDLMLTTMELCGQLINVSTDIVVAVCSIPGKIIGAMIGAPIAGFADPSIRLAGQFAQSVGMKSALNTIVKKGQEAIQSGPKDIANLTSGMRKK